MRISPKQFLKTRRPEQFSDSIVQTETLVDRLKLEHYLDTLSNRSQELEFEEFAKSLCETTICPNLLPHTGPSGGGDSKVDSETYPVSDTTSLSWFVGIGRKANSERWGFAFSIKKAWQPKVNGDIKKISDTKRNYKVAFFVSNQYVPDKQRAKIEDDLRTKYKIDVRIFDRNWILNEVFKNNRQNIVKEKLHVDVIDEVHIKKGPLDIYKEDYLDTLDKEIEFSIKQNIKNNLLVEKAIKSAILSRELEKTRVEVDGRFDRAERLAKECGNVYQKFDATYQYAWTTFWWHEDFTTYIDLYKKVEELAIKSENIYDLERLTNLWYGLNNLQIHKLKTLDKVTFNEHTRLLKNRLVEFSREELSKPSASLFAKSLLLQLELTEKLSSHQNIDETLKSLKSVVIESKNLIGFPFKVLVQVLTENSDILENSKEYSSLFEVMDKITEERDGELSSAKLHLVRGEKLLELDRPYEAIQVLGVCLSKLHKNESKEEVVRALYLISVAYERVGLYWAARGSLLSAASLATSSIWNHGQINTMQTACYRRLKWIELKLGRIPQALDWHKLDDIVRHILLENGYDKTELFDQVNKFDLALGILFLRSDLATLKTLELLPDSLFRIDLYYSATALIYSLGCIDDLPKDFTDIITEEERDDFFKKWAEQYSNDYLASTIQFNEGDTSTISSTILGCNVSIKIENGSPCLEVAESILAALESFLSTGMLKHAASRESSIVINVDIDNSEASDLIRYSVDEGDERPIISVYCKKFSPHKIPLSDQGKLRDLIFKLVVETAVRIAMFKDPQQDIKEMMRNERVSERALNFTSSFVTLGNLLGHNPKTKMSEYMDAKNKKYSLERKAQLKFSETTNAPSSDNQKKTGDDPFSKIKHDDIKNVSLIRNALWDMAGWQGAGFALVPDGRPPIFSILFKNVEAGKKIFKVWQNRITKIDKENEIRVTIVERISQKNPYNYRVGIGSNFKNIPGTKPGFVISATRIHTMTPQSSRNLDNFKDFYSRFGYYLLTPGGMGQNGVPEIIFSHGILKKEIEIRQAYEIGVEDIDSVLILPDDNPIIPPEIKIPPVVALLKKKRSFN